MTVFISYRRGDSAGHAGRLRDALEPALGPDQVFQDVTSLAPGEHFADAIRGSIESADVVLVVIGRHWADAADAGGGRRLDDPADVVRLEVETALASGRRTVPVLVDGATLPSAAALPPSMAPLLEVHAAELHDGSWSSDVDRLVRTSGLGPRHRAAAVERRWAAVGLVAVALAVIAAVVFWPHDPDPDGDGQAGDDTVATVATAATTAAGRPPPPTAPSRPRPAARAPARASRAASASRLPLSLRHRADHRAHRGRLVPRAGRGRPPADQRRPHRHRPRAPAASPSNPALQRQGRRLPATGGLVLLPRVRGSRHPRAAG